MKWARAGEITALLNFYHEFRGSDYRHGKEGVKLRGGWHDYCKKYKELKEKYEIPMLICVSA